MSNENLTPVAAFLKEKLTKYSFTPRVYEYGTVRSCIDEIVQIDGLSHSRYGELLEFGRGEYGLALDLREDGVGAVLLSKNSNVVPGDIVKGLGRVAEVGVGTELLGRVVDPIGRPLDGLPLDTAEHRPIEYHAPAIMQRSPVNKPLQTGILSVDSMIPVGRGQRELIIGDRQTGKTSIALSAIINQKDSDVVCIYCAIGQKATMIAQVIETLRAAGAMKNTVIVASTADDCSSMQYLTPYAGCAIAEKFMYEGRDTLVVYDDLSKHAVAYRAMSLLLRRPSGREAYPGDVFYLHSRLLERAARLSDEMGGGSMTALPIIETMAGDISAYIPTNVISITDGQIFLETELFNAGVRPAVNVGLSVSRVGRSAQNKAMKDISGSLRLELAQYRDTAVFAQFGADIDDATVQLLRRGECLTELLKQDQNTFFSLGVQTAILRAYRDDLFRDVPRKQIVSVRDSMIRWLKENAAEVLRTVNTTGELNDADEKLLTGAMKDFFEHYHAEHK